MKFERVEAKPEGFSWFGPCKVDEKRQVIGITGIQEMLKQVDQDTKRLMPVGAFRKLLTRKS